ncbi:nitrite reductase small subunit NirD [Dactylosporangium aurantiacum]|uniref:Nitrite reductase small subunit NirD n=1 Tax=Dactylosporangium aurantiacum TaxID=35754 RepID=A0A9Q9MLV2_9ACTN|nr:nitrite reductase small subunit NirD [Dactylosporangium aurantiacum]MDG6105334.1 nitrite reductase small subunit NirD [Dactylosporangium aurantiacum]UWZ54117.1 nitrite reductase small subunit NirD [Dactylosporangium aurantiacum]
MKWTVVCPYPRLEPERGVAALVDGAQVALFRVYGGEVHAIGNLDPISGAAVLSRGIVGSRGDVPTVASPMHKQAFDLRSGECLDQPGVRVPVYPVRVRDGLVEVATPAASAAEVVT